MSLEDSYLQGSVQPTAKYSAKKKFYSDTSYDYVCYAKPGTALTASKWMVVRFDKSTDDVTHADYGRFTQPATNVSVVAALSYV
jgi:hypothetical protein